LLDGQIILKILGIEYLFCQVSGFALFKFSRWTASSRNASILFFG
jgi:hypothetical protein